MKFTEFAQQNLILAENQEEYLNLPVNVNPDLPEQPMAFCLELDMEDIERLIENKGRIFINQLTFGKNFQPISISLQPPATLSELTKEELTQVLNKRAADKAREESLTKRLPVKLASFIKDDTTEILLPQMPDGTFIPNIQKDSMVLEASHEELKAGLLRLNLSIYIKQPDKLELNKFKGTLNLGG